MTSPIIDVSAIPPRDRHPLIFGRFRALAPAQSMELINDHDPRPLRFQMENEAPGGFAWEYLQAGPQDWHVRITRLAVTAAPAPQSAPSCCGGGCGGA